MYVRTYVRTGTLRKWYFGIFSKNSYVRKYVRTDLDTSIKLFVVPRESTDF